MLTDVNASSSSPTLALGSTRLIIKSIEVENFKSYAGRHRIGPFHHTFTAVIGPNGSGKSNVIDSLLFVFGRSARKIRLEKLSELIHSSAKYPNFTRASVTVHFCQVQDVPHMASASGDASCESLGGTAVDGGIPPKEIPGSEFCISREVLINNHSQYFINGSKCTQRNVIELLTTHGVDLDHNRFLILQGEVEQISLMKPRAEKEGEEGLVEYFDDIIGSNQFVGTIKEATTEVEALQEERLASLDVLVKVRAERDALSGDRDAAMSFLRKDVHLQKIITVLCQLRLRSIEQNLVAPRQAIQEHAEGIEKVMALVVSGRRELADVRKRIDSLERARESAQGEVRGMRRQKEEIDVAVARLQAEWDQNAKMKDREGEKLRRVKEEVQRLSQQVDASQKEAKDAEEQAVQGETELARLVPEQEAQMDALQAKRAPLVQELEMLKRELAPFDQQRANAKEKLEDARHALALFTSSTERQRSEIEAFTAERDAKLLRHKQLSEELAEAQRSADSSVGEDAVAKLQAKQARAIRLKFSINSQIEDTKREHRESESGDAVHNLLLRQRNLTGYYGVLRQLGSIDAAYDVAAGVGSNMWGYHVVEDEATATAVVAFLRQNNLRATMIVLRRVAEEQSANMARRFDAPEGSKRLYDLITPVNERFAPAFYQALRNTLVVDTLTEARRIAFGGGDSNGKGGRGQRYRVVTKSGELVEPSGAVTGGGSQLPRPAQLRAQVAPADRAATLERLRILQAELEAAVAEERECGERLAALRTAAPAVSADDVRRMRRELAVLDASVSALNSRLESARNAEVQSTKSGAAEHLAELHRTVEEASHAVDAAAQSCAAHAARVDSKAAEIANIGGPELVALTERIAALRSSIRELHATAKRAKSQAQRSRAGVEGKTRELQRIEESLKRLQTEQDITLRESLDRTLAEAAEAEKKLQRAVEAFAATDAPLTEARTSSTEHERTIQAHLDVAETHENAKRDIESKIAKEQEEIGRIEERIGEALARVVGYARDFGREVLGDAFDTVGQGSASAHGRDRKRARESGSSAGQEENESSSGEDREECEDGDSEQQKTAGSGAHEDRSAAEDKEDSELSDDSLSDTDFDPAQISLRISDEKLETFERPRCEMLARQLQEECKRLNREGNINFSALASWRMKQREYKERRASYETVRARFNVAEAALNDIITKRKSIFMESFRVIQQKLKETYQLLAQGGDADVELVDATDPYEGISFTVRPPRKSWKQVHNLSGGEKTLSSLALVFALHHIRPTPIYVMDEIDAALDFRNVSIVGRYVLEQSQGAQFLIISLRNNMFELAHQLVGISKVDDVTRSVVLNPLALMRTVKEQVHMLKKRAMENIEKNKNKLSPQKAEKEEIV